MTLNGLGDYEFKGTPSVGARVGAWAGDKLGNFLGRITGLGDYRDWEKIGRAHV